MLSFRDLEMKFGPVVAYQCLAEIEKAARIQSFEMSDLDPETRLAHAICTQDNRCGSVARYAA